MVGITKIITSGKLLLRLMVVLTTYALLLPAPVYAYLDPGTGSYIFQLIIGFVLAGLFAIKAFWKNIKSVFANLFSKEQNDEEDRA